MRDVTVLRPVLDFQPCHTIVSKVTWAVQVVILSVYDISDTKIAIQIKTIIFIVPRFQIL